MFDYEIDNPMTLGEYPDAGEPDIVQICPHCGTAWEGWADHDEFGEITWESDQWDHGQREDPVRNSKCPVCVWEERELDDARLYVVKHRLQRDFVKWYLGGGRSVQGVLPSVLDDLWEMFVLTDLEYLSMLTDDFVSETRKTDFVDWMMSKGEATDGRA